MQARSESLPIIFAKEKIDVESAEEKLTFKGAHLLETKECWLLRESSVPGLLSVTYFDKDKNEYQNLRLGFVDGKWTFGPKDREEAIVFAKSAQAAFKGKLPGDGAVLLFRFLKVNAFSPLHMMRPEPEEVTKTLAYIGYTDFDDDDESTSTYGCSSW